MMDFKKILLMKKLFLSGLFLLSMQYAFSQSAAIKPRLMIIPSDYWCTSNKYMQEIEDQGRKIKVPQYTKALQENAELNQVISTIGSLMIDRGFELELLKDVLQGNESDEGALSLLTGTKGDAAGSSIASNDWSKLYTAKCDIILEIDSQVISSGFKSQVNYTLTGKDNYTRKQIAGGETRIGSQLTTNNLTVLLKEAVLSDIDNFNAQLQGHFDKLFQLGREVTVEIMRFEGWSQDLETEFNGLELGEVIEKWMKANTKNGRFSTAKADENQMVFKEVRIPLFDKEGNSINTRDFVKDLQKYLKAPPYNITGKIITKGLGQAALVLGGK
jgi:hypothetical protein